MVTTEIFALMLILLMVLYGKQNRQHHFIRLSSNSEELHTIYMSRFALSGEWIKKYTHTHIQNHSENNVLEKKSNGTNRKLSASVKHKLVFEIRRLDSHFVVWKNVKHNTWEKRKPNTIIVIATIAPAAAAVAGHEKGLANVCTWRKCRIQSSN